MKSDVGEISTIKKSAVTSYMFDKENAASHYSKLLKRWKDSLEKCATSYEYVTLCEDLYLKRIASSELGLKTIPTMPDIKVVRYRTIDTNVNGDKTASGYKYVACFPEGSTQDQANWFMVVRELEGVIAEPQKEIENNLIDDGKVVSSVKIKVCEKYGNI